MNQNDLHDCFSNPLNSPPPPTPTAAAVNPKKKRTKLFRIPAPSTKPTRKPDPAAPKITRPCTECGKRFWSWKALFGHMRCHPDRQWRGINPPSNFRPPPPEAACTDDDDREVAECLLMLANQGPLSGRFECGRKPSFEEEPACCVGHKCSVCLRVFSSGQALGGHKRCHREIASPSTARVCGGLDLNLPLFDDPNHDSSSYLDLRLGL